MSMEFSAFQVAGMSCQGCANTVSAVLGDLDGVATVEVELSATGPATVRVQAARKLTVAEVADALRDDEEFTVIAD
jgi:copper chaperone CopZ